MCLDRAVRFMSVGIDSKPFELYISLDVKYSLT